jgi:two-component sensor histidine kinase
MASLAELARLRTDLDEPKLAHLQRLVGSWGLLSDFCFADLLLYVPEECSAAEKFVVVGQIRPATSQTVYRGDWVGTVLNADDRPIVASAFRRGEIVDGSSPIPDLKEPVRVLAIPVRWQDEVIAVLTRESALALRRQQGELERIYVEVFNRFARMISLGDYPFADEDIEPEEAPRVGDGVMVLDLQRRVEYTSPNAVSALHRVGVHANVEGLRLGEFGLDESVVDEAYAKPGPAIEEIDHGPEVTVLLRCIPLLEKGTVSGAVVLLRDISELRRRDRLLLSKDATIREIHHRVKNNLQTISSLLRLQGRRLESREAKAAIDESVRRVRSIALVHEILSREAGEDVAFVDIVRPICRMVEDAFASPERPVRCIVEGEVGELPAHVATPLAVVLNELLQNAFDHAYPEGKDYESGAVVLSLDKRNDELVLLVTDDGAGLPDGFELESSSGLGLSIVRTLVTSELGGSISMRSGLGPADRPGAAVELRVPVAPAPEPTPASL